MIEALATNWGWLLFRAILAAAYGLAALAWPEMTLSGFVYLFGLYTVFDGMVAMAIAIDVRAYRGFGSVLFEALVRIGAGLMAMGEPDVIVAFPRILAGWAILTGVAEGIEALVLRRELAGEWPLPVAGAISIIVGVLLLVTPVTVDVSALRWLVGPYALIGGVTLVAFARRLHQLAREMQAA
jgi:uncharacterized membrane protein HdeD (DUF308 family)